LGAAALLDRYQALSTDIGQQLDAASQARRRLKRRVLELLALIDADQAHALAARQYQAATGMTDRLAALGVLVRERAPQAAAVLADFRQRYADNPLALDKWFAEQAKVPGDAALASVMALESDPAFTLKNPNRARAVLGSFANSNPSGFHRTDGAGYRFFAERLMQLDALNPQISARLATAFNGWQRLEPVRREAARASLEKLAKHEGLSRNLNEIIGNVLHR
jgi:aminopeptidase N